MRNAPHCLHDPYTHRSEFASAVYEATGDLNVVAELCGHESIETTRVYAKVTAARRRAAVALIA